MLFIKIQVNRLKPHTKQCNHLLQNKPDWQYYRYITQVYFADKNLSISFFICSTEIAGSY